MKALTGTIAGTVGGVVYFNIAEGKNLKDSNASYLSPVMTDILAWLGGAFLIYKGHKLKDGTLSMIGSTVVTIHVCQFAAHKVLTNRSSV